LSKSVQPFSRYGITGQDIIMIIFKPQIWGECAHRTTCVFRFSEKN